jgi:hypothetical protein
MKKTNLFFGIAALMAFVFASCKVVQAPKFTSVENLYSIKLGCSFDAMVSTLGSKPYDMYMNQSDGYTIYTYKYKNVERKINPNALNQRGGEVTGNEVYNSKEQTAYFLFKNDKLESFTTTNGRKDGSALIMINNTLFTISKDKDKYTVIPAKTDEPVSSGPIEVKKKFFLFRILGL